MIDYFCRYRISVLRPKKIVITGGPGTGKSSVIQALENSGYYCFHEIIRTMTLEAKKSKGADEHVSNPLLFSDDPMEFNRQLLEARLQHFKQGLRLERGMVFFDRGIPDVLAYMEHFGQDYGDGFLETAREHRYDQVFLLPPWESIYVQDNERLETFEEAVAIHHALKNTYENLGYQPEIIPEGTIEERAQRILRKAQS